MEHFEFVLLVHHLIIIALTAICSILWIKTGILKKRIEVLEEDHK